MEATEAISEGEWSSLSGMYTTEEADFMAQLLGNCTPPSQVDSTSNLRVLSNFWPSHESTMNMAGVNEGSFYSMEVSNANLYHFSQGSSSYSGGTSVVFPTSSQEIYYLSESHPILINNSSTMSMDFCMGDVTNTTSYLIEGNGCSNQETSNGHAEESGFPDNKNLQPKRDSEIPAPDPSVEYKRKKLSENSKKRSQKSGDAQKIKRNVRLKKSQKIVSTSNNDEENNASLNGPASSSCCSKDESNASQELYEGMSSSMSSKWTTALNLNGKTRASRGAATDPQSLYARKRRERINERLRTLQNLVPNGTKVDISTMLEEAVQYVKFLQLQIKLLSSDDLWMYAPIAYNGMDIGLDLRVTTPR